MDWETVLIAFGLTLFAGLSTGIGSAIALFTKRTNKKFLSISMGFSAGVMIYVSFVELFFQGQEHLTQELGEETAKIVNVAAFFGGILLIALIDKLIPNFENPHEFDKVNHHADQVEGETDPEKKNQQLMRIGMVTAFALAVHNFPEGMATFASGLSDLSVGFSIAIAVAIHNIPEGIAVSVPILYATGDRRKAFWYSFLSGLAEPIGALVGYLALAYILNDMVFGILFSSVAGIMVFISLDQLLPAAEKYGEHHLSIYGLVSGMAVMALSLLLL